MERGPTPKYVGSKLRIFQIRKRKQKLSKIQAIQGC